MRNGVTPPQFLTLRVAQRDTTDSSKAACCCCASHPTGTCGDSPKEFDANTADEEPEMTFGTKTILMWKVAECRGLKYLWSILAAVYVAPTSGKYRVDPPFLEWIPSLDQDAPSHRTPPEPPVP